MLKNAYFLKKTVKDRLSVGGSAPNSRLPPAAGGSYYNFVKSISSAKCVLLR